MVAWAAPKGVNERATSWVRVPFRGLRLSCATLCVGQLHWTKWLASILHTLALQSSPRPRRGNRSELGRRWAARARCAAVLRTCTIEMAKTVLDKV